MEEEEEEEGGEEEEQEEKEKDCTCTQFYACPKLQLVNMISLFSSTDYNF